jgi:hypothetical protein
MIYFFSFIACYAQTQDSTTATKKFFVSGYLKDLQTFTFTKNFDNLIAGNLIHNRINLKWKPAKKVTVVSELRNRFFWGEEVKLTPGFARLLRNENEKVNLQKSWVQNNSLVLHTNTERLYFDYNDNKINFRLGRQRINWGITTTWNPNDIFNTYNFLDFDYEERPGVDGAKFRFIFNNSFNTEAAYIQTGKKDGDVAAVKLYINKWGYDMQLIPGWYKKRFTLGAGWAGSIKEAGFKGEVQYFFADKESKGHLNLALEGDYMFKKGWYVDWGMLYNNQGLYKPVNNRDTINLKLSFENPMPTKWNMSITTVKELTPLLSANMTVLFAPGTNLFILFPSLQYNIATNFDINLVWQSFFADLQNNFEAVNHRCFLRIKWSF